MIDDDSKFNRRFLACFALLLFGFAGAYIWAITFYAVPKGSERFADTALGFILGTVLATPIAFYFGSSKSSQAKDTALAEIATAPPVPPVPAAPVKIDDSTPIQTQEVPR